MIIYRIEYHSEHEGMLWCTDYYTTPETAWERASDLDPRVDKTIPMNMAEGFGLYSATLHQ